MTAGTGGHSLFPVSESVTGFNTHLLLKILRLGIDKPCIFWYTLFRQQETGRTAPETESRNKRKGEITVKVTKKDLEIVQSMNNAYLSTIDALKDYTVNTASALYISNLAEAVLRFARIAGDSADTMTGTTVYTACLSAATRYKDNEPCFTPVEAVLRLGIFLKDTQTQDGKPIFTGGTKANLTHGITDTLQSLLKESDRVDWRGNITRGKNGVKHAMKVYFNSVIREMGFTSEKLF